MKKIEFRKKLFGLILVFISILTFAQDAPPPPPPTGGIGGQQTSPIDGYTIWLAITAVIMIIAFVRKKQLKIS